MDGLIQNWSLVVPVLLGAVGIFGMLPRPAGQSRTFFGLIAAAGLALGLAAQTPPKDVHQTAVLFYVFSSAAIVGAGLMVTNANPAYAALWFAFSTLGVCGLFLLNSASFLAAATVIVYAGAIVVTFLFVLMLAQQAEHLAYDGRSQQPIKATVGAFVLLGCLLFALQHAKANHQLESGEPGLVAKGQFDSNPLSRPLISGPGALRGLGRSLFGDYVYSVELAGTLLLIATIGAIAVAPRRAQGHL